MFYPRVFLPILFLVALSAAASIPELQWEAQGFLAPESIVYDATRQEYYVSNMGTFRSGQTPGDGFISRLSANGKMLELRWVQGLENPKGLALSKGHLFVGDDVYLTEIDVATGRIIAQHKPAESDGDFNDCTADAEGNVYVCSGKLGTVFRLHDEKFEPWMKLDFSVTGWINGLRAEKDRLLLGGWSVRRADGSEQLGHLSTVDYRTKSIGRLGNQPICHIDGLEPDGKGGYLVSDWISGEVFHVSSDGKPALIFKLSEGTADFLYREDVHLLLIPLMNDHVVRAYGWTP